MYGGLAGLRKPPTGCYRYAQCIMSESEAKAKCSEAVEGRTRSHTRWRHPAKAHHRTPVPSFHFVLLSRFPSSLLSHPYSLDTNRRAQFALRSEDTDADSSRDERGWAFPAAGSAQQHQVSGQGHSASQVAFMRSRFWRLMGGLGV